MMARWLVNSLRACSLGELSRFNTHKAVPPALLRLSDMAAMFTFFRHPSCDASVRPRSMVLGNGLLVGVLVAVNIGRGAWDGFTPSVSDLAGVAFLGVVQIGIAYAVFGFGIARVAALEAALIGMLEPVLNPVWVFLFLGETPGWWAVLGGVIIIATITGRTVILERRAHPR